MKRYATIGFMIGSAIVAGQAVAAWTVSSKGEASVKLASLTAVQVAPVGLQDVFPGDVVTVKAKLDSKNARPLKVRDVTVESLDAGECNLKLASARKGFAPKAGWVVPVGESEAVLGTFEVPPLGEQCQGQDVKLVLALDLIYGGVS